MLGISYQKSNSLGKGDNNGNSPEPSLLNVPATIPATGGSGGTLKTGLKGMKGLFKKNKDSVSLKFGVKMLKFGKF